MAGLDSVIAGLGTNGRVYGDPVELDGMTLIPVAKVTSRKDTSAGDGGGALVSTVPVGFIRVVDGNAKFHRIGPSPVIWVLTVIGVTIVLTMAVIGAAWGHLGRADEPRQPTITLQR